MHKSSSLRPHHHFAATVLIQSEVCSQGDQLLNKLSSNIVKIINSSVPKLPDDHHDNHTHDVVVILTKQQLQETTAKQGRLSYSPVQSFTKHAWTL